MKIKNMQTHLISFSGFVAKELISGIVLYIIISLL